MIKNCCYFCGVITYSVLTLNGKKYQICDNCLEKNMQFQKRKANLPLTGAKSKGGGKWRLQKSNF
ncbi:hypothetical protein [Carboxydothermus ferrireducens]|uniref:Uncharacterized protein n=1 Tax=Carboxydothermus ferrireducens DSM 11255 TaxID=1119529 RepID=A0ABX2RAM0_9THEO|nr:hypothetical protein [Carboxydothermus ferrireducens]NYE57118.1 hypothetical protein [Carboxydothermus ferrireducens DSM 11255]